MPGLFIVLEGPDGAGTTTHAALLAERLESEGHEVVLTMEPTDGEYGKRVRAALTQGAPRGAPTPEELQQLFCADRAEHVTKVIQPAVRAGKIVICDRYVPSTLIYGEASGVSRALLEEWNAGFPAPALLFLLLPPFEAAWKRVEKRDVRDVFEQEQFQRKVYEGYTRYAAEHSKVRVIDTSKTKEESADLIWGEVRDTLTPPSPSPVGSIVEGII